MEDDDNIFNLCSQARPVPAKAQAGPVIPKPDRTARSPTLAEVVELIVLIEVMYYEI